MAMQSPFETDLASLIKDFEACADKLAALQKKAAGGSGGAPAQSAPASGGAVVGAGPAFGADGSGDAGHGAAP